MFARFHETPRNLCASAIFLPGSELENASFDQSSAMKRDVFGIPTGKHVSMRCRYRYRSSSIFSTKHFLFVGGEISSPHFRSYSRWLFRRWKCNLFLLILSRECYTCLPTYIFLAYSVAIVAVSNKVDRRRRKRATFRSYIKRVTLLCLWNNLHQPCLAGFGRYHWARTSMFPPSFFGRKTCLGERRVLSK